MKYIIDPHTHTVASNHAYSTVMENARVAEERGIRILGMTDHGPRVPGGPHIYHFTAARHMPRQIGGVRILFGVEANIITVGGKLDLDDGTLGNLDLVLAGIHRGAGLGEGGKDFYTKALVNAVKNPWVNIITHPYNEDYEVDMDKLAQAAADNGKLLEINASYFYSGKNDFELLLERMKKMVAAAKKYNTKLVLGSDAHMALNVGRFAETEAYFEELGIEAEMIVNSNEKLFLKFIKRK